MRSRTLLRSLAVGSLATGLALPLSAGSAAFADSTRGDHVALTCGSTTYQVVVAPGNGNWTPALDSNSNLVFVPHAFQGFTGQVYDTAGHLVDSFSDPTIQTQGSGKQKNDLTCTFRFSEVSDGSDPEGPPAGYTFVGSGGVTGQLAGHA